MSKPVIEEYHKPGRPSRYPLSCWESAMISILAVLILHFHINTLLRFINDDGIEKVREVEFSPDGKWVARASGLGLSIYDTENGKQLHRFDETQVSCLAFSSDSKSLATGGKNGEVTIRDIDSGLVTKDIKVGSVPVTDLALSPNSTRLYSLAGNEKEATRFRAWKLPGGEPEPEFTGKMNVEAFALSPDGQWLVVAGQSNRSEAVELEVWDLSSQSIVHTFPAPGETSIHHLSFAPDSRLFAAGCGGSNLRIFDVINREEVSLINKIGGSHIVFSSDASQIATTFNRGVRITNIPGGAKAGSVIGHRQGSVEDVWFAPDRKSFKTTAADGRVVTWDLATMKRKSRRYGLSLYRGPGRNLLYFAIWGVIWIALGYLLPVMPGIPGDWPRDHRGRWLLCIHAILIPVHGLIISRSYIDDYSGFFVTAAICACVIGSCFLYTLVWMFRPGMETQRAYCRVALALCLLALAIDVYLMIGKTYSGH